MQIHPKSGSVFSANQHRSLDSDRVGKQALDGLLVAVILVGCTVLIAWMVDSPTLKSIVPGFATMKANTALCFVLCGVALYSVAGSATSLRFLDAHSIVYACASVVTAIAVLTLAEDALGWNTHIDQLLFFDSSDAVDVGLPGRMSQISALNFVLACIALVLLIQPHAWARSLAQWLAVAIATTAIITLMSYLFGASSQDSVRPFLTVAIHTALTFFILGIGLLAVGADRGWMNELMRDTPGAAMGRRLSIATLVVLPVVGGLRLAGQRHGWYGTEFGVAVTIALCWLAFMLTIWIVTRLANRANEQIEHLSRTYATLSNTSQLIVRERDRLKLLTTACRTAVQHGSFNLVWIGWAEADSNEISIVAHDVLNGAFDHANIPALLQSADLRSTMASVLIENRPIIVHDLAVSGRPDVDRVATKRARMRTAAIIPIHVDSRPCGVFAFCSNKVDFFDEEGMQLLVEVSNDVGFALEQIETDRRRHAAEASLSKLNIELESKIAARTADLQAANEELEAFSAMVSHDLRAPLRAIDGYSQMLAEHLQEHLIPQARDELQAIRESRHKMERLIEDLLAFAKFSRQPIAASDIDTAALVAETWCEVSAQWPTVKLGLGATPLPNAWGDRALIKQVWSNLLLNAAKYSSKREQPRVQVSGEERGAEVIYCVRDNGVGFDPRYAHRLFEAFQRLHVERDFPGTGMGLAIVRRLVTRQGGRVWAESTPGDGATFWFSLPKSVALDRKLA